VTETGAGISPGKPDAVGLADKVDFLSATGSYPSERLEVVEARETHMSWVFLTDRFAYKLKKPVRHAC
jgi:aminoglycoside phosphotransferase family enzyme